LEAERSEKIASERAGEPMGARVFQTNAQERTWEGFILAPDITESLPLAPSSMKAGAAQWQDVVAKAWTTNRTIVTSDGPGFAHAIRHFQNPPNPWECRDLWGLLVLPGSHEERVAALDSIIDGLTVFPRERLLWPGAGLLNLYVGLTRDGNAEVRHFERCLYCERTVSISEPWDCWYRTLPGA
jgi:hypothetical protein